MASAQLSSLSNGVHLSVYGLLIILDCQIRCLFFNGDYANQKPEILQKLPFSDTVDLVFVIRCRSSYVK
jgi:hypothetical protein